MNQRRLWHIVWIGGAVIAASMAGCKRDRIEQHRVAKVPAGQMADTEPLDAQTTNTGKLPSGHPDISNLTPEQMQELAKQMPAMSAKPQAAGGADVTFTLPAGWTEKIPPGQMLLHEFTAGEARMTVSMFPGPAGGLLANVNRWRRQLHLPPVDQQGLMKLVKPVQVDNVDGWRVNLTGEGDGASETIGVVVERENATWFFKLNGARNAVATQAGALDEFMKSVKWKS